MAYAGAFRGEDLDEDKARYVRVIEYEIPDREQRRNHLRPFDDTDQR